MISSFHPSVGEEECHFVSFLWRRIVRGKYREKFCQVNYNSSIYFFTSFKILKFVRDNGVDEPGAKSLCIPVEQPAAGEVNAGAKCTNKPIDIIASLV